MEERVTIHELARVSGVSVGTVSRALNGYTDVRPETRERIMRLARELDYTPAAAARSLVTQRSHIIGVFMETGEGHPDLQHPFFHEVLGGLKQRVGAEGFDLLLFASERPGNGYGPHSYLKRARHHNVDGCALIGLDPDDAEVRRLMRAEIPCVGIDMELEGPSHRGRDVRQRGRRSAPPCAICTASATGGSPRSRGWSTRAPAPIACAATAPRSRSSASPTATTTWPTATSTPRAGGRPTERLLALAEPPTAIFAASDLMAIGAIRAAAEAGPARPRGPLDHRLRRHPARPPRQPAPHHACARTSSAWAPRPATPSSRASPATLTAPRCGRSPSSSWSAAPPPLGR